MNTDKPGAWVDLGLTLPVFLTYHAGVVFLNVKNAADIVSGLFMQLAEGSVPAYLGITLGVGVVFASVFYWLGRGQAFRPEKFVQIALEGVVYATVMRFVGSWVVAKLFLGKIAMGGFTGFIMSLGAGFYEELAYRVLLFGLGAKLLVWLFARQKLALTTGPALSLSLKAALITIGWSVVAAAAFSGVHYVGPYGDTFELKSFVFRWVLGLTLTLVFATRGFAAAVWTHALYDVWVLVF